jgi:hypothetical protein
LCTRCYRQRRHRHRRRQRHRQLQVCPKSPTGFNAEVLEGERVQVAPSPGGGEGGRGKGTSKSIRSQSGKRIHVAGNTQMLISLPVHGVAVPVVTGEARGPARLICSRTLACFTIGSSGRGASGQSTPERNWSKCLSNLHCDTSGTYYAMKM